MAGHQILIHTNDIGIDRGGRPFGRVEIRDRLLERYTINPPDVVHSAHA